MADTEEEPPEEGEEETPEEEGEAGEAEEGAEEAGEEEGDEEAKDETKNVNIDTVALDETPINLEEIPPPLSPFQPTFSTKYLRLPLVEDEPVPFEPKLYTFRVPNPKLNNAYVRKNALMPPFHILLDHTIAVVWSIFCNEELNEPLGTNQLQWALLFLKSIVNRYGEYPPDVKICIEAIEENLISNYSMMAECLPEEPPEVDPMLPSYNYKDTSSKQHESIYLRHLNQSKIEDIDEHVPKDELMKELEEWKLREQKNVKMDIDIIGWIDKFIVDLQGIKTFAQMECLQEAIETVKNKRLTAQDDESEGGDAEGAEAGEEAAEEAGEGGDEEDGGEDAEAETADAEAGDDEAGEDEEA